MVVTDLLATLDTGVMQERWALPSIKTVHAPHWPSPQPYLLPVRSSCSRSTESKVSFGSASTRTVWPLIRRLLLEGIRVPQTRKGTSMQANAQSADSGG